MSNGLNDGNRQQTIRANGATPAERYLQKLCENAFLRLWSYPGVYRDQGKIGTHGDGKEVCDLLVVFENHVIIFSDKSCVFQDSGDVERDWCRWYRRAILESAKQVWGAERWIRENPKRLFLDHACTNPFPFPLPDPKSAIFHRIVVAHNSAIRSRRHYGGSGSLMLMSHIVGDQHTLRVAEGGTLFAIGQIDPTRGFVHVLDDVSMDILLETLNTISDFVGYLTKKEAFIKSDKLGAVAGEEDLLAFYLKNLNTDGEHDFIVQEDVHEIWIEEGFWNSFQAYPQRLAQLEADRISYSWDALIEKFTQHVLGGTLYYAPNHDVMYHEKALRFLAREPRVHRRYLSERLVEFLKKARLDQRSNRLIMPTRPGEPCYVFLALANLHNKPDDEFRAVRSQLLEDCCIVAKLVCPEAEDIVGIATEPIGSPSRSEDLFCIDVRDWTQKNQEDAKKIQDSLGLFTKLKRFETIVKEFPDVETIPTDLARRGGKVGRNDPCPCGSGKKFKKCCGGP